MRSKSITTNGNRDKIRSGRNRRYRVRIFLMSHNIIFLYATKINIK